ncbi:XdhC family protein [Nonomuraea gerenzanensis]|uniref:Aerobic carbon monoxide dehydrogenase molybdenum cofactor insertion protein CoxF n=1 Tax=Nonomuraea gerenzanensis TaxID=93944 RepID=A0A1M4E876_9ACTN|nr:XdhC family protein [Nonomuraea gerenzanensis]UBU17324.1 XdhC family protein [Nonomuraea gerenzanensis]SBO95071.1 Aerobic carbon monoxide dehydrogenase molybdenum cofactor insertion protein CoxF [Nonomuraea gerenzanensis]
MTEFIGMPTSRPRPVAGLESSLDSRVARLRSGREPYVLATVVRAQRPTSAKAGDRALVLADGTIEGFVGGVCATDTVRAQGLRLMGTGGATLLRITPEEDAPREEEGLVAVGQPCLSGGTLEIFLESVSPPRLVRVHGDSPIARAFAAVGQAMGYTVEPGPGPIAADTTAVLVASHGVGEEPVLREALAAGVPYVGLIASRRRGAAVLARVEGGERVHVPAGLDIGARTPGEVAVSVYAEIIRYHGLVTRVRQEE